ncbi:MAG TPA: hypothetical protein VM756_02785 [Burkholderiales bacterium]|nr:hypothetical protein [Burkholderiales bacterium]
MEGLLLPALLVAQGVMAGVDTVLNHELIARLPQRPEARTEIGLHVLRELVWTILFAGLAWFAWYGAAAALIALVLAVEIAITACDEFVENRMRVLPQNERVLHVFLTLNLGVIVALLAPRLLEWGAQPTALAARSYGVFSWMLTLLALAAAFWSLRDFIAWRRLR